MLCLLLSEKCAICFAKCFYKPELSTIKFCKYDKTTLTKLVILNTGLQVYSRTIKLTDLKSMCISVKSFLEIIVGDVTKFTAQDSKVNKNLIKM
jgi:hypothetical protein